MKTQRILQNIVAAVVCTFASTVCCTAAEPPKDSKSVLVEDFFKSLPENARPNDSDDIFAVKRANEWIAKNAPGKFLVFHFDSCITNVKLENGEGKITFTFLSRIPEKARYEVEFSRLHKDDRGQVFLENSVVVPIGNRKFDIEVRAPRLIGPNEPAWPGISIGKLDEKTTNLMKSYNGKPVVFGGKVHKATYIYDVFVIEFDVTTAVWIDPWENR